MRRIALALGIVATFALVTAAVTSFPAHGAGEPWHIYATVDATEGSHEAFYVYDGKRVNFPDQATCEHILGLPQFVAEVKVPFETDELVEHGAGTTFVWRCKAGEVPGQDI